MKLIKIGNRYINPEKVSVVYGWASNIGGKQIRTTVVALGDGEQEYAMTEEDIESVVKKITQEGATDEDK